MARIASPAEGGIYDAGTEIQFQGSCNDSGNGALGGASLVWASDADGQISTGEAFASGTLSAGAHKITLTCTDADGATGTDTVDVLITSATAGVYALTPDAQGYLVIPSTNTYRPGDTIYLSGNFKSVAVYDLMGSAAEPVTITNAPGQAATIGDQAWSGGSWAQGLVFRGSHYVDLYGSSQGDFKITGSTSTVPDSNGYPVRTAYIDLAISETSDNFTVHDITITGGGAGLWAKTEVSATDAGTWYPNTYLDNFEFYNLDISNTYNEAMYIGHTATYWNIDTNTPYYPSSPADTTASSNPTVYKQPIKLRNVKIHDDYIHDIGNDGIQTAAIEGLEVYNNEVTNWATKHGAADNGGILIGGRVKGFDVHDNYVHDSWGELMQVYAEGGGTSLIDNNLLVGNQQDGVSMRGTNDLVVTFTHNTVALAGQSATRVNGYFGQTSAQLFGSNLFVQPGSGSYIYTENGGSVTEGTYPNDDKKFAALADAGLDTTNYYQPNTGSPAVGYGYIVW